MSNNIQNIAPIGQLAQAAIQQQHTAMMRQQQQLNSSSNNIKYNKENLGANMRTTPSSYMNQGRTSQQQMGMMNHNHHPNQLSQQFNTSSSKGDAAEAMLRQQLPMTLLNKTTSFLSAATNAGQQSTKGQYANNQAFLNAGPNASQQTQQSHREFGRDISNIAHNMVSSSQNLNQAAHQKEAAKGSSSVGGTGHNRIPQPSIIDSATGRMNQGHSSRMQVD